MVEWILISYTLSLSHSKAKSWTWISELNTIMLSFISPCFPDSVRPPLGAPTASSRLRPHLWPKYGGLFYCRSESFVLHCHWLTKGLAERKIPTGSGFRWALGREWAVGAPGEGHVDPSSKEERKVGNIIVRRWEVMLVLFCNNFITILLCK